MTFYVEKVIELNPVSTFEEIGTTFSRPYEFEFQLAPVVGSNPVQ